MSLKKLIEDNKKNIVLESFDSNIIIKITFRQLCELFDSDNGLKIPEFQVSLNEHKIEDMIKSYLEKPKYFATKILLTVAQIQFFDKTLNLLIDGQHRAKMIQHIYKKNHKDDILLLNIIKINNEEEVMQIFTEINRDSYKFPYKTLEMTKYLKIESIKKLLSIKYNDCYSKTDKKNSHIYTLNDFMQILLEGKYFEQFTDDTKNQEFIDDITLMHDKFFTKIDYLAQQKDIKKFYADELDCIQKYKNVIFFKNNNFTDYLCNNNIKPKHEYRNQRGKVSLELKQAVWKQEFDNSEQGICPVYKCKTILKRDRVYGFIVGHIVSVSNGGSTTLDNLRPICQSCNSEMKDKNWNDFEQDLLKNHVWTNYFEDADCGDCQKCNKEITKKDYRLFGKKKIIGKKTMITYYPYCLKCFLEN